MLNILYFLWILIIINIIIQIFQRVYKGVVPLTGGECVPLNCNLCAVWLSFIIHFIYMYINSKVAKKKNPVLSSSCINIKNLLQHILRHHFKTASSEEEKKTVEKT